MLLGKGLGSIFFQDANIFRMLTRVFLVKPLCTDLKPIRLTTLPKPRTLIAAFLLVVR